MNQIGHSLCEQYWPIEDRIDVIGQDKKSATDSKRPEGKNLISTKSSTSYIYQNNL
jgi:hypothetical protein